jgi:hypothetical protein
MRTFDEVGLARVTIGETTVVEAPDALGAHQALSDRIRGHSKAPQSGQVIV